MFNHQFCQCPEEKDSHCEDAPHPDHDACYPDPDGCMAATYTKQGMTQIPYATTCHSGVVERATDDEAKEGKDISRYITPAHLKQGLDTKSDTDHVHPYATTEIPGFVERATDAEASAGVDEERYVNPKQLKQGLDEKSDTDHVHPYATTEIPGFVERATDAEAAAGVDEERYVNPRQLQQGLDQKSDTDHVHPYATTELPGFVERATDAEAAAGVDEERYVNPKQLQQGLDQKSDTDHVHPYTTTEIPGFVERATDAEATAGVDEERYVNPKQLQHGLDQKSDTDHVHPYVPLERKILTQAPLSGGGALGADLTLAIAAGANDTCLASQNGQAVWVPCAKVMTADVHLYVSLAGNDQNSGAVSSPVRTVARALALSYSYQRSPYYVWIHVAPGEYAEDCYIDFTWHYPRLILVSDTLQAAAVKSINSTGPGSLEVRAMAVSKTGVSGEVLLGCHDGCSCSIRDVKVTVAGEGARAIAAYDGGRMYVASATIISNGKANIALYANSGKLACYNSQIQLNFNASQSVVAADMSGTIRLSNNRFSGTATGLRYTASTNGMIWVGAGSNEIPGTTAGWTGSGGQYLFA